MFALKLAKLKQPGPVLPIKIHNIFVDALKRQIEPRENLNVVLSKLFVQILKIRFGFQLSLVILRALANEQRFESSINTESVRVTSD